MLAFGLLAIFVDMQKLHYFYFWPRIRYFELAQFSLRRLEFHGFRNVSSAFRQCSYL